MEPEHELTGGNASGPVVRVGGTVRKPWTAATPSVLAYLAAVRSAGVDVPAPMGRDDHGRQVQEFVPGRLAMDADPLTQPELQRVGSIVRAVHDASEGFVPDVHAVWDSPIPAPGADLVCHNDLAPWNLIVGDRWVFIDWDGSALSTRLWDLAYAAQAFTLNQVGRQPEEAAAGLGAFVDGYGADEAMRSELPSVMADRTAAMLELLSSSAAVGREPWGSMYVAGHGDHWAAATRYVRSNVEVWHRALHADATG